MNLFFLLVTLTIVNAGVVPGKDCEGIIFDGNYHDKETLKSDLDRPYLPAVDYHTNTLYFSYNVNETTFTSARYDLGLKEFKNINDVPNGFAQAVDHNSHTVYIGGSNGIYKYDPKSHISELYAVKDIDIWRVYFEDVLYFSEFPAQFLNTFKDGRTERFKDLEDTKIDEFVIDNEDYMFYTNETGLYSQKKGDTDKISVLYDDVKVIRALAVDIPGDVYVCSVDSIYRVDKQKINLEKLFDVDDCFGLTFDGENNMIYSDSMSLVRLKLNKDKTC